jgi:hypothetical protein
MVFSVALTARGPSNLCRSLFDSPVSDIIQGVELQDYIEIAREKPALPFLLIGGYAVAAHGHSRTTFDVDFLGQSEDRTEWRKRLLARNFNLVAETSAFAQFSPPDQSIGLDLMFVAKETFDQFWKAREAKEFGTSVAEVPSLDHLLALKLHVLKQGLGHRTFKDAQDVEMLARRNKLNLDEERYEKLFLKHGTREIYETIKRILRHG